MRLISLLVVRAFVCEEKVFGVARSRTVDIIIVRVCAYTYVV